MRSKILVILLIFVFCVYDFAYSHSGRTNASGCHNVTATGGYHCHGTKTNSSNGSSRIISESMETRLTDEDILGLGIIIVGIIGIGYLIYSKDTTKYLYLQSLDNPISTRDIFMPKLFLTPSRNIALPDLRMEKQRFGELRFSGTYLFRF